MRLDPMFVRVQIEALRLSHPEIWDEGDEKLLEDMLSAETNLDEFLEVVEDRRQEAAAMAGMLGGRIAEIEIRQARFVQREKAMRELALSIMQKAGVTKRELPLATLSVRAGSQSVSIEDDTAVPDDFANVKTLRVPDRARIKEALKDGAAFNWAQLVTGAPSLSVRTK